MIKIKVQLFGGRGVGSGIYSYHLPKDPTKSKRLEDITHPTKRKNTPLRNYRDKYNGLEVEFHPKNLESIRDGWTKIDHYHVFNPNSTGDHDKYLDKNGIPCRDGSDESHLKPGEYRDLLRRLKNDK